MRVRVLAFATAAEAAGGGESEIELPEGSRLADLRAELEGRHPALAELWPRLAIALDGRLAGDLDAPLADGAEVALLPPVSGGSGRAATAPAPLAAAPAGPTPRARLVESPLDPAAVAELVASPARGAVVTFVGTVRDHHRGRPVERLRYAAYRPMAERALAAIVADLEAEHDGLAAAIVHRLGEVPAGEASVVIAVASPHREAAFAAARRALERLKREAPIWKREHYADGGAAWREEEPLGPPPAAPDPGD